MTGETAVGFIGLGAMGGPMARNLVRAGFDVTVYNRTQARTEAAAAEGAAVADSPAGVATPGGIVVSMLSDDDAVRAVVLGGDGFGGRLGKGGLHVSMSTVSAETSRELAARHAERDEALLAAPVFGRPDMAEAAKLNICAAGPDAARERARPLLEAMGAGIWDYGDDVGAANIVKLAGNFMIAAACEAMGEAYTLCERHGISRQSVHELLSSTLFASPVYQGYGAAGSRRRATPRPASRCRWGSRTCAWLATPRPRAGCPCRWRTCAGSA